MKGGFNKNIPGAPDFSEFSDSARAAKSSLEKGEPVFTHSTDALRGGNYALVIQQLWPRAFERFGEFNFSPNPQEKDRWVDLRDQIKSFIEKTLVEIFAEMLKDERFSINYQALKVLGKVQGNAKSPAENIMDNIESATNVTGEFGEMAISLAGKDSKNSGRDAQELARSLLHSNSLFSLISAFAYLPGNVAQQLASRISISSLFLQKRGVINPMYFSLKLVTGREPEIEMSPLALSNIRTYEAELRRIGTNAVCPAALAKSPHNGPVTKDFIKWMLEQVEKYYLEECLRRQ